MNDRFKFRVWDKGNEQYLDPEDMDCICLLPDGCFTVAVWDGIQGDMKYWANEDIVVEMSTGLKDKNGNLIYEGDIVATKMLVGCIMETVKDIVRYDIARFRPFGLIYKSEDWEIVGNIHEYKGGKDE